MGTESRLVGKNGPKGGLGIATRLSRRRSSRRACRSTLELTLLTIHRLTHWRLLGLRASCTGDTRLIGRLLTLEGVAKVLEAHLELIVCRIAKGVELNVRVG